MKLQVSHFFSGAFSHGSQRAFEVDVSLWPPLSHILWLRYLDGPLDTPVPTSGSTGKKYLCGRRAGFLHAHSTDIQIVPGTADKEVCEMQAFPQGAHQLMGGGAP